jgi:hypothetical protein
VLSAFARSPGRAGSAIWPCAGAAGDCGLEGKVFRLDSLGSALDDGAGRMLVGHPYAGLGRAEDIRTAASAFDAVGIPFAMRNLYGDYGRELAGMHNDFNLMHREDPAAVYRANVLVLNADELERVWEHQRTSLESGAYNIGYRVLELSHEPDAWLPALEGLDEVSAPSRFIRQAVSDKAYCPVVWMPLYATVSFRCIVPKVSDAVSRKSC